MKTHKLVVVGVGHVGSYVLVDAAKSGLFSDIGVIDIQEKVAFGEALDQAQATALPYMNNVHFTSGGYEQCKDADIIVIAAGQSVAAVGEGEELQDRAGLIFDGAKNTRQIMRDITAVTKEAIIINISNPCDALTYLAATEFDYPKGKVFGTGTMLDSARLRYHIANHYGVDPKSVSGYMMGEHGKTAFPVLSRVSIGGVHYDDLDTYYQGEGSLTSPDEIAEAIVVAAYDVLNNKGWTNAAISEATLTLVRAILQDERSVYPVSVVPEGEYGYNGDVAFSMPCIIGKNGIEATLPVTLNEWETQKLTESADYIKETIAKVK